MVLAQTITLVKLWFADWDPDRTLFGLGWLFEFNLAELWFAYAVAGVVIVASLFVERAWCRYACPLGGLQLAPNTDPNMAIKDSVTQGKIAKVTGVQKVVAVLQAK
jgi:polyferredoxin